MEVMEDVELCFPQINASCKIKKVLHAELIDCVLICITLFTVFLNLLVIISIAHFRQLRTTTNLLLLSLAVADFCVGLLQMPVLLLHKEGCWYLGEAMCTFNVFFSFLVICVSVGSMVLISVDRYIAICEPMFYTTKVTVGRVQVSVCLCWLFSSIHGGWILRDFFKYPSKFNSCYGGCVVVAHFAEGVVDLVATFLAPILVIAVLYLRVFVVAVSQARAMRIHVKVVSLQHPRTVKAAMSELKAARTLGVVIVVFLLTSCPYYCLAIAADTNLAGAASAAAQIWLLYCNSCLNPVIYVFFYPWFRRAIKHILTLKILHSGSREVSVL